MKTTHLYLLFFIVTIVTSVSFVALALIRDFLSRKFFAKHRLDLLHAMNRYGAGTYEFGISPIKKQAVFGEKSLEIFEVAGILHLRKTVQIIWIFGEVFPVVMIFLMAIFLVLQ